LKPAFVVSHPFSSKSSRRKSGAPGSVWLAGGGDGGAGDELEGDVAAEAEVFGFVDDAHAACSDAAEDFVVAQSRAWLELIHEKHYGTGDREQAIVKGRRETGDRRRAAGDSDVDGDGCCGVILLALRFLRWRT
jgi:hypothetical protein